MDDSTSQQPPPPEASPGLQGAGILDDLAWRGLLASTTDLGVLREQLDREPMTLYVGFDPTAASLHVGHLAQTLTARRFQLAGHRVLLLVGGATGLIGDPKPTAERALNEAQTVHGWAELIRAQLSRFFEFSGPNPARMVNNYEWTQHLSVIDFLRDIGKHFSVNRMLDREAVARRLGDQGISYTEFSYVLLQSLDFLELYRRYGCRLQTGGSDQFGNIVAGVDLIRRVEGAAVHALTTPLVTKADGTKFGKTEGGALWLDPALTSPYAFYQYWLNTDDRDIAAYLKMFSFQTREHIESLLQAIVDRPEQRAAQRALAQELTELVHGPAALASVMAASAALFGGGSLRDVDEGTLTAALSETPFAEVDFGPATTVVDLLVATGLAASRGAARRTIKEGGAYLNNVRVVDDSEVVQADSALAGGWFVLRRGRRNIAGVTVRRG